MKKEKLKKVYYEMLRIRMTELEISKRYDEKKMRCPTHLSVGQEGVPAMLSTILRIDDFAVSTHRGHAHYLSKGGSLKSMIAEIYGKETGCSRGKGGSMHLIDESVGFMGTSAIVGNSIPLGVGLALSQKIKNKDQLTVVYLGDGATEEGVYYESLNFAAVKNLPVLFVCENNKFSVYSPMGPRRNKKFDITKMASSLGINSVKLDGNDVLASYSQLSSLIHEMRISRSPLHLEFDTYRWLEHCGPNYDDQLDYREKNELEYWLSRDPIKLLESKLREIDIGFSSEKEEIELELKREISAAFLFAEGSSFPDVEEAYFGEYAK